MSFPGAGPVLYFPVHFPYNSYFLIALILMNSANPFHVHNLQDESAKQAAKLMYQTALMESGFMLNDPKEFATSIYDSVKASLKISSDAEVEEDNDTEEAEAEEKGSESTKEADADIEDAGSSPLKDEL